MGGRNCPQCGGPGGPQAGINQIHIEDFAKSLRMEERDPQGGQGLPQAREAGGLGKGRVWRRGAWGWICGGRGRRPGLAPMDRGVPWAGVGGGAGFPNGVRCRGVGLAVGVTRPALAPANVRQMLLHLEPQVGVGGAVAKRRGGATSWEYHLTRGRSQRRRRRISSSQQAKYLELEERRAGPPG